MLRMLLGLVALSAVLASAVLAKPPGPTPSNEFRFIGFTDPDTIAGDQGMIAMHALCQDDFGLDARMCTDKEFWLSPNAEAPAADSWFQHTGFDFEGANCLNWTDSTTGEAGGGVDTDGKSFIDICSIPHPVTCCAPIQ